MRRESRISRLYCKQYCELTPSHIMTILTNTMNLHSPPPCPITFLKGNSELIHINELPPRHLIDTKGGDTIEETVYPELCVITIGLVGFGGGLLLGNVELFHLL
jgi:hypothetical protein